MAVGDACDHRAQADPLCFGGQESQYGVGLEKGCLGWLARDRDLEEVIHGPQAVEAGLIGAPGRTRKQRPHLRCLGRHRKAAHRDTYFHGDHAGADAIRQPGPSPAMGLPVPPRRRSFRQNWVRCRQVRDPAHISRPGVTGSSGRRRPAGRLVPPDPGSAPRGAGLAGRNIRRLPGSPRAGPGHQPLNAGPGGALARPAADDRGARPPVHRCRAGAAETILHARPCAAQRAAAGGPAGRSARGRLRPGLDNHHVERRLGRAHG